MLGESLIPPPGFNPEIQKKLVTSGYAVLVDPFFNNEEMARICSMWTYFSSNRTVMSPTYGQDGHSWPLVTSYDRDIKFRQIVQGALITDVAAACLRVTDSYRVIGVGFIDKGPGDGLLPTHQDASIVQDETKVQCFTIWVALVDVDESNGCLSVIPCSHLKHRSPRSLESAFPGAAEEAELRKNYSKSVPLKAGEAVVFDRSLFHDSAPNITNSHRPAVQIVIAPKYQQSYFHIGRDVAGKKMLDCYSVPDDFFLNHVFGENPPAKYKVGTMTEVIDHFSLEDLATLQREASI
jgi:hypothetical protein